MSTGFFSHPAFAAHAVPPWHPECPQRLSAISDRLLADGLDDLLEHAEAGPATDEQLLRVHTPAYLKRLATIAPTGGTLALDEDTWMAAGTLEAARLAAGAAVGATRQVTEGTLTNAFCSVRPPGHHAMADDAMGFCFFNNVAVAARFALEEQGLERIAILDFDVHHGNGTEAACAGDDRLLYCSVFEGQLFPQREASRPSPTLVAVPLPGGTRGEDWRPAVEAAWVPAIDAFAPQLILVSAGFDGHRADPLSTFRLRDDDYRWVSELIVAAADRHCEGRLVSCLEGGYAQDALARCVGLHLRALLGL